MRKEIERKRKTDRREEEKILLSLVVYCSDTNLSYYHLGTKEKRVLSVELC